MFPLLGMVMISDGPLLDKKFSNIFMKINDLQNQILHGE